MSRAICGRPAPSASLHLPFEREVLEDDRGLPRLGVAQDLPHLLDGERVAGQGLGDGGRVQRLDERLQPGGVVVEQHHPDFRAEERVCHAYLPPA